MVNKAALEKLGIEDTPNIYQNLCPALLVEESLRRQEGILSSTGALAVETGKYTGRSPNDRFIVECEDTLKNVDWNSANKGFKPDDFDNLSKLQAQYLSGKDLFIFEGFIGNDPKVRIKVRVINELAWQNLFIRNVLVRPKDGELDNFVPDYTIIVAPGFKAVPERDHTKSEAFIILNMQDKKIIIGGSSYGGEIKKSCFTLMNYLMPAKGIFPMHCSANLGKEKSDVALFFGLSGTGKTTLSADPGRSLIGDDEHGWSDDGIFNFEGGCYAKCINLTREGEPQIWDAISFGAIVENVIHDPQTRVADYADESLTENTRAGYSIDKIPDFVESGRGDHPSVVVFLTADAFGVLPPISRLDKNQASYHFLSGYTSKLAGTERGITEPQTTFSTGFGAPFLLREAGVYAQLLRDKIEKYNTKVYLLNTGWSGGKYGVGSRMKLAYSRAMVTAALNGDLDHVAYEVDPIFNLNIPKACPNVPSEILNPINTWKDKEDYTKTATQLAAEFHKNFSKLKGVNPEIAAAGPNKE